LGIVPLLTGAIGFCPIYAAFGFNTCPTHSPTHSPTHRKS
jgi:hypothetical protein